MKSRVERFTEHLRSHKALRAFTDGRVIVGSLVGVPLPAVQVSAINLPLDDEAIETEKTEPDELLIQVNGWCDGEDAHRGVVTLRDHLRQAFEKYKGETLTVIRENVSAAPPIDGSIYHRRKIGIDCKMVHGPPAKIRWSDRQDFSRIMNRDAMGNLLKPATSETAEG